MVRWKLTQKSKLKVQNYNSKVKKFLVSVLTFDFCALNFRKRAAFTLIELLVTIAVVAVLSGVGINSFIGAQKTGRDGKRMADLETIRSALEIYRSDTGKYVVSLGGKPNLVLSALSPNYIQTIPVDQLASYKYYYSGTATGYTLCAYLERTAPANLCGAGNCGSNCNYKVTNP